MRLAIVGSGKMGHAVARLAEERGHAVTCILSSRDNEGARGITRERLGDAEVVVEFTAPTAAVANARASLQHGYPIVVGTTGWHDRLPEVERVVREANGALLWAANFSVGVALFSAIVERAGRLGFGDSGFDAHLVETHHSAKKDAPSGTALALKKLLDAGLGRAVPVSSVRTGHVPGTHEVIFDGAFEQIRLTHEARDRRVFADGALRAAEWLRGRRGVFTMRDVLNLDADGARD